MKFWLQWHDRMTTPSCVQHMSVQKLSLYLTENTHYDYDKDQTINAVQGDSCCSFIHLFNIPEIHQSRYRTCH